jgi:hypothetical protein
MGFFLHWVLLFAFWLVLSGMFDGFHAGLGLIWVAPGEVESNTPTEVSVRKNGEEVAWGSAYADLTYGWGRAEYRLVTPASRPDATGRQSNAVNFTIQDVTPGPYELVLTDADGREFRRFTAEGGAGTFTPHPRSVVSYEPRASFLTPRRIGGSNLRTAFSTYWVLNE